MPPSRRPKRGLAIGPTKRGKGIKIMAAADQHGRPLALTVEPASPPLPRQLENRAPVRLARHLPPPRHSLGVSRPQLPRHGPVRLFRLAPVASIRETLCSEGDEP